MSHASSNEPWPALPYADWKETCATLQLWTQIVGKIRLTLTPWLNHSWHVTLYVDARGLTTSLMPHGDRAFDIAFDFVAHELVVRVIDGARWKLALRPRSVADFHAELMDALSALGLKVQIARMPNEIPDAIPFDEDSTHAAYDAEYAHRFWRILVQVERVFSRFRTEFIGKCSLVHFFWGSFDLAVTRFSGRRAPLHPGGVPHLPDAVVREAYSHEVSSAGFWPGGNGVEGASFYSYAYPQPPGYAQAAVSPDAAYFEPTLGEFLLPYDAVRRAPDPDAVLLAFLESTYAAAADLARWDRQALECPAGEPRVPRPIR